MTMSKGWQWDVGRPDEKIRVILKNPHHPSFIHYASLLLARTNTPKMVFEEYLEKPVFCLQWSAIKRHMRKDRLNHERIQFWEQIYRHLKEAMTARGIKLRQSSIPPAEDSLRVKIGKRIQSLRKSKNLTQADVAQGAGLTQQFLSKIERGSENISLDTLERLQKYFKEELI